METRRLKRRKMRDNPYVLLYDNEKNLYRISFKDSNGIIQNVNVNKEVYDQFDKFELEDLSWLNEYDNHIEHSEIYDNNLYHRSVNKSETLEFIIEKNFELKEILDIINKLPVIQKRRLKKYYFENKTYEKIAKEEKCTKRAIKFSIDIAIDKISKKMNK